MPMSAAVTRATPQAQRPSKWLVEKAAGLRLVLRNEVSLDVSQVAPPVKDFYREFAWTFTASCHRGSTGRTPTQEYFHGSESLPLGARIRQDRAAAIDLCQKGDPPRGNAHGNDDS